MLDIMAERSVTLFHELSFSYYPFVFFCFFEDAYYPFVSELNNGAHLIFLFKHLALIICTLGPGRMDILGFT